MKRLYLLPIILFILVFSLPLDLFAGETTIQDAIKADSGQSLQDAAADEEDYPEDNEEIKPIYDPIEPFNRIMFKFNDRLYFWVIRPVTEGYTVIVPVVVRRGVRNFFSNITTPIRFVNSILQLKFHAAGRELSRFVINTTLGVGGLMDPAKKTWHLTKKEEDLGQSLGVYGAGPGIFITWPILGPSSIRDTIGMVGDLFLDPTNYLFPHDRWGVIAIRAYERINETSFQLGTYESLTKEAFDPYIAVRNAYHQHRENLIKE